MSSSPAFLPFARWLTFIATFIALPLFASPTKVTDEECNAFGVRIAAQFSSGEHDAVVRQLDTDIFINRVSANLGHNEKELNSFQQDILSRISHSLTLQFTLFTSARYLRIQNINGEKRVLIRCVRNNGAMNYFSFLVSRRATGPIMWSDAFTYLSGEEMSAMLYRFVMPIVLESQPNLSSKFNSEEIDFFHDLSSISHSTQLIAEGKFAEALSELDHLPAGIKNKQYVFILRFGAAKGCNQLEYNKVLIDWEKIYSDDFSSLNLATIDGDLLLQKYDHVIKRIDALNRHIGGDNYLTLLKGNILMMVGEYDEARRTARAVLASEPTITNAWFTLLNTSLNENKYKETAAILVEFESKNPGAKVKSMVDTNPDYAEFRASKEYQDWAAKRDQSK